MSPPERRPTGRVAAMLAALLVSIGSARAEGLRPFTAVYTWSWHGMVVATSTLKLDRAGADTWTYSSTAEGRGIGRLYPFHPRVRSLMRVTARGIEPLHFEASGGGANRDADVRFDWPNGRATGTYAGVALDMPISAGLQDDLSVQIEMMWQQLSGHTPPDVSVIDKNVAREYWYRRERIEPLDTPLGHDETIVFSSQHPGSPRTTYFWSAPQRDFIPLRVEQQRKGSTEWSMLIQSLTFDD